MPSKSEVELEQVSVMLEKKQSKYLKKSGMQRSKFCRQAIEAHQAGKWDYEYIKDDIEE